MKKDKKVYTKEQTEQFLFDRNAKRQADKGAKRNRPVLVHSSAPRGVSMHAKGTTFFGSIREQFTGQKRCGISNQ